MALQVQGLRDEDENWGVGGVDDDEDDDDDDDEEQSGGRETLYLEPCNLHLGGRRIQHPASSIQHRAGGGTT